MSITTFDVRRGLTAHHSNMRGTDTMPTHGAATVDGAAVGWRNMPSPRGSSLRFDDCVLDLDRFELRREGEVAAIEPRAMRILIELLRQRDRVVSRAELLDSIWGDPFVSESAVTTQIKGLRRAIGDTGREQRMVKTVHGRGYMFIAPVYEERAHAFPYSDTDTDDRDRGAARTTRDPVGVARGDHCRPVVAVLPFTDLAQNPAGADIAQGLTQNVIAAMSKHRWLNTLAGAATDPLTTAADALVRVRETFDATYAVEGSVHVDGSRLRVTASLTATDGGTCLWADRFDRECPDLFDMVDEASHLIVATVEPTISAAERQRSGRRPATDMEPRDLYHLATGHMFRFTADDNRQAQRLLDRCRKLDPAFAAAHAWWAFVVVMGMVHWDGEPDPHTLDAALTATDQALQRDHHDAAFHALRGRVLLARREHTRARRDYERALELNPALSAGFAGLGEAICYSGSPDEAIPRFERSVALGSHDPQRWAFLTHGALALVFAGRYDEAIDWADRAAVVPNCQYWATAHKVVALALAGRSRQATTTVSTLLEQYPPFSIDHARRKLFYLECRDQLECYLGGLRAAGIDEE